MRPMMRVRNLSCSSPAFFILGREIAPPITYWDMRRATARLDMTPHCFRVIVRTGDGLCICHDMIDLEGGEIPRTGVEP